MWEATIQCTDCDGTHAICCNDKTMPRVFVYVCPKTGERVDVRYRDPSRILAEWTKVTECSAGAVLAEDTSSRGAFEG